MEVPICDAPGCKRQMPDGLMIVAVRRWPTEMVAEKIDAKDSDDPDIVARVHESCYLGMKPVQRERRGWPELP